MSPLQVPVHVEGVGAASVRYFQSPAYLVSGRPDMPWHACNDLWNALGIDEVGREKFLRSLRSNWWDPKTVATSDGPVVIAPYLMGDIIIEEWLRLQRNPGQTEDDDHIDLTRIRGSYRRGNTAALKAMTPHLSGAGKMVFAMEAMETMDEFREKLEHESA